MKICPKCKAQYNENEQFCSNCGTELEEVIEAEVVEDKEPKKTPKWLVIVFSAVSFLIFTFALFGYLGPSIVGTVEGTYVRYNVLYYFGGGVRDLINLYQSQPFHEYFAYKLVLYLLQEVAYFGGFVTTIIFAIKGILEGAKNISNKEGVNKKNLLIVVFAGLPHIFLSIIPNVYSSVTTSLSIGWGVSLLQSAFIIANLSIAVYGILRAAICKDHTLKNIFVSIATFLLAISTFVSINNIVEFSSSSMSGSGGPLVAFELSLKEFSGGGSLVAGLEILFGSISLVFMVVSFVMSLLTLVSLYKGKVNRAIIFIPIKLVAHIISVVFAMSSVLEYVSKQYNPIVNIASAPISHAFLSILCLVFIIVASSVKNEKVND